MQDDSIQNRLEAGIKLISSAANADDALAEILKVEASWMKNSIKSISIDELSKLNTLLKNTVAAMILTSEKIETGIDLIKSVKHNDESL